MCGICGILSLQNCSEEELIIPVQNMVELMTRRGPDDEGLWHDGCACALGFRRLSILDLSETGHQPMVTMDGRFTIVMNGEVYNFQEIRSQLESKGYHFRSTGDTEVALNALAEWGADALTKFNGMFALAFYDRQEQSILLARDHAGIKPLYYMQTDRGIVFASQYNQIVSHPWAKEKNVSQDSLSLYLRFGWVPAPYGLIENTHLLEPGKWLKVHVNGKIERGTFFEFPKFVKPTLKGDQAIEALDEALNRAVSRHLISDVPVGLFLSGGIDSPLVATKAQSTYPERLLAFNIGIDDLEMDESTDAKAYAKEINLEFISEFTNEDTALGLLDDVVLASTDPSADFSIFPTMMVSQLASRHVKVVLTGDGGDELFWGYTSRFISMLQQAKYFRYPKPIRYGFIGKRKLFGTGYASREVLFPDPGRLFQKKHTIFPEPDLIGLFPELESLPLGFTSFSCSSTDMDELAQWTRWNEFSIHLARVLMKVDRASMHNSLETRLPLLDKDVINVAIQTDWQSCLDLNQRVGKIPLRALLRRSVSHHTHGKKGFTVPMRKWLQGPLQELVQVYLLDRKDILGQPINQEKLQLVNEEILAGNNSKVWGVWLLLSLALWEKRHMQGTSII